MKSSNRQQYFSPIFGHFWSFLSICFCLITHLNMYAFVLSLTVDDSAILDCQFSDFYHTPPQGYQKILFEQQIF